MMIYSKYRSARLRYVLDFIFGETFRTDYRITDSIEELKNHAGCRISYADEAPGGALHIPAGGLLFEGGIRRFAVEAHSPDDRSKVLFYLPGGEGMQYDVFSAIFYMISRYEEYLPFEPDPHGRFEARNSLAAREDFLEFPVVDLWLNELREKIIKRFPGQQLAREKFTYLPTIDVDQPFAVLHRGILRTAGAQARVMLRSRSGLKLHRSILKGKTRDPFDTYDDIEWLHARYNLKPIIFFLCAPYARYDRSIPPGSEALARVVDRTAGFAHTGIHPSYRSGHRLSRLSREIRAFEKITGEHPVASRQHYLRLHLPQTYRNLIRMGIGQDYSMGFASRPGFRAGTSRSFYFFDLEKETKTPLKIFPFQIMDRSLKDYLGLSAEEAVQSVREITDRVYETGGTLVSIWHNEAFSNHGEWKGWREVYVKMLEYTEKKSNG